MWSVTPVAWHASDWHCTDCPSRLIGIRAMGRRITSRASAIHRPTRTHTHTRGLAMWPAAAAKQKCADSRTRGLQIRDALTISQLPGQPSLVIHLWVATSRGIAVLTSIWLKATETDISDAQWTLSRKGLYFYLKRFA